MKTRSLAGLLISIIILLIPFTSVSADRDYIPSVLKAWEKWVLHGMEDQFCPTPYDNGSDFLCAWPSRLNIDLDGKGGQFSQQWATFNDVRIPLPGNENTWPSDVKVNGRDVPVVSVRGIPHIFVEKGRHSVSGRFRWQSIPEMINIPEKSGLVSLVINKNQVQNPLLDRQGRLWLQRREEIQREEDRYDVKIFRMIDDDIPMKINNLVRLSVSGQAREIMIEGALFKDFIPMSVRSPLPVLVGEDGGIMVQARPGQWDIHIVTRSLEPVDRIGPLEASFGQEIWAFNAKNHLRMVEIEGVPSIDPGRTELPSEWKQFPSYLISDGDAMELRQIRRGDPDPAPDQLHLQRTLWLDFDGQGYTIKDNISGTMNRQWFIAMNPPTMPGRVSIDGEDQLITAHGEDEKPGVVLRKGHLNIESESRFEAGRSIVPAVGWDHDVQSLSGTLNLPPGWRLFAVNGVDSIRGTWLQRWSLLDLFVVLIISVAVFKLWNLPMGVLSLVTLIVIYHEPDAPRVIWVHLLASAALLRFIQKGWFRKLILTWRVLSIIILFVIAVPFMLQQARHGLYPQLETSKHSQVYYRDSGIKHRMETTRAPDSAMKTLESRTLLRAPDEEFTLEERIYTDYRHGKNLMIQDPNALIQTGPGLPQWRWKSYSMNWNGPVDSGQEIRLWLVSPFGNRLLAFIRIILLAFMVLLIAELKNVKIAWMKNTMALLFIGAILMPGLTRADSTTESFPPSEILKELRERLLEKPACLPFCADSPKMDLNVDRDNVRIVFRVHAEMDTAVPLPGSFEMWRPENVMLGSVPADILMRDSKGTLWIYVPEGIHDVILSGKTMPGSEFQISLPMKPHGVSAEISGWSVQGIDREGRVEGSLRLTRIRDDADTEFERISTVIRPFYHVERVLSLGLEWQVITTVTRLTVPDSPVVVSIPLLEGESVLTGGIRVENREAIIHMSENTSRAEWISALKPESLIMLKAPEAVPWTETWILDAAPVWHFELSGIPLVHHQDSTGQWRPEWKPWQGEEAAVKIFRPEAIPGRSLTVDNVELIHTPGKRISRSALNMTIRSSQGVQHSITLPEGAELQQVRISGRSQPVSRQDRIVTVPVNPGTQNLNIEWQEKSSSILRTVTPQVSIGTEAVNANVSFQMPENRWILMTRGPVMGPAVLFWTYLVVIILAAALLGKITLTPLKTASWLLLGLGLTQVPVFTAVIIAGWFLIMGIRKKSQLSDNAVIFNMTQVILVGWFIVAMAGLWSSIKRGLLGIPDMQIAGNGSSDYLLNWTQDRIVSMLPECSVLSVNIYVFKGLMLLWALWLSYSLILKWLPWAWDSFNEGGIWKKFRGKGKGSE